MHTFKCDAYMLRYYHTFCFKWGFTSSFPKHLAKTKNRVSLFVVFVNDISFVVNACSSNDKIMSRDWFWMIVLLRACNISLIYFIIYLLLPPPPRHFLINSK